MSAPLAGLRVIEVAQYVAGPWCGRFLAELGADVIKVEPPGGDAYRGTMPIGAGFGRFFLPLNRGKRSVVLDLKTDAGRSALRALVKDAAIVLHNSPPERAKRFGLDAAAIHCEAPSAVIGVVSSFGAEGPLASAPAYDLVAQARAGLLTAHASPGDDVPVRAGGVPLADLTAGMLLATSVLAALVQARETGVGSEVSVSLLAAALAVQVQDLVWTESDSAHEEPALATRVDLARRADEIRAGLHTNPYYRCYEAADGFLAVACLNLAQRDAFADLLGVEDSSITAPDLAPESPAEAARRHELTSGCATALRAETVEHWLAVFGEAGIPCGPVLARERVLDDPQIVANALLTTTSYPVLGAVVSLDRVLATGESALGAAPSVGQHTNEVLAEVGVA